MSNQWFRMYAETLNDEKVQALSAVTFKNWVNLLCFCSKFDGVLPHFEKISFALRITKSQAKSLIIELKAHGLIDPIDGSSNGYKIHSWDKRQYKSDTSKERMKRHRDNKCDVTVTPPDNRLQNTDTERKKDTTLDRVSAATSPEPVRKPHVALSDFFKKSNDYVLQKFPALETGDRSPIVQWEAQGADYEKHVKPAIDTAALQGKTPSTFSYFTPIIKQFVDGLQQAKTDYSTPEEIFKRISQGASA